jgi:hypothetical protein
VTGGADAALDFQAVERIAQDFPVLHEPAAAAQQPKKVSADAGLR